jgi:hypothetical protein
MTTFGDTVYHNGGVAISGLLSQGKSYHLKASSGTSGGGGLKIDDAVSTLTRAKALMAADQNDVLYFYAEDNSASGTTDYQSAALVWSTDLTHIVGVNTGGNIGQRSRIAQLSTATGVSPLMTWSASSGSMRNIHVLQGVADATSKVCFKVTGERNYFADCHFAGIGNTLQDAAAACSLEVAGDENVFERCTIGLDTIGRGSAANSELLLSGGAARTLFRDCTFLTYADAATHQFVIKGSAGIDRYCIFDNCKFINAVNSGATSLTEAFDITAGGSPNGAMILNNCIAVGIDDWDAGDNDELWIQGGTTVAASTGIAVVTAA